MTEKQPTQKRLYSEIDDEEFVDMSNLPVGSISTSQECSSSISMKSHNASSTPSQTWRGISTFERSWNKDC